MNQLCWVNSKKKVAEREQSFPPLSLLLFFLSPRILANVQINRVCLLNFYFLLLLLLSFFQDFSSLSFSLLEEEIGH